MEHRLQRQLSTIVESMLSELSHIPHLFKAKYKTKTFIVLKQVMQKDHVHSYHLQKTWICICPGRISVYPSRVQLMSPFNKQTVLLRLKKNQFIYVYLFNNLVLPFRFKHKLI